jgi:hypothetical protein
MHAYYMYACIHPHIYYMHAYYMYACIHPPGGKRFISDVVPFQSKLGFQDEKKSNNGFLLCECASSLFAISFAEDPAKL